MNAVVAGVGVEVIALATGMLVVSGSNMVGMGELCRYNTGNIDQHVTMGICTRTSPQQYIRTTIFFISAICYLHDRLLSIICNKFEVLQLNLYYLVCSGTSSLN